MVIQRGTATHTIHAPVVSHSSAHGAKNAKIEAIQAYKYDQRTLIVRMAHCWCPKRLLRIHVADSASWMILYQRFGISSDRLLNRVSSFNGRIAHTECRAQGIAAERYLADSSLRDGCMTLAFAVRSLEHTIFDVGTPRNETSQHSYNHK